MSSSLSWVQLRLPVPIHPDEARAALDALAGLSGQPRVVLEAVGSAGTVSWRLGADRDHLARIVRALTGQLPELRADSLGDSGPVIPAVATRLAVPGHRQGLLDVSRVEPVSRGVLAALSATRSRESVRIQVILGVRHAPRTAAADPDAAMRRRVAVKLAEHRFGCTVRFAATAATSERAFSLVSGVVSALRPLQAPGVSIAIRRSSARAVTAASSPYLWPLELAVSELVALVGWPVARDPNADLPGMPPRHPEQLPVPVSVPHDGRSLGISATDPSRRVAIGEKDSLQHLHVLGPTGVGKSTLLAQLALSDMEAGRGLVVVDPKGDLVTDLLARVPDTRRNDVVVLDPSDPSPVGLNPLALHDPGNGSEADLAADSVLNVFHELYADSWGPRTHDILHASLLTLARRGDASLVMIPLLLTNPGFRRSVTARVVKADPMGLGSFWAWFEAISDAERSQVIAPLMNKLRPILLRPSLRGVFGQRQPKFSMAEVFTKRKILLVSLAKGTLGSEGAQLLGSLVVAQLWRAALGRVALAAEYRRPVMVVIDEVQDYLRLPGDLGDALAQARGLGVGFTLAHQHLAQLPPSLKAGVLANARSRVCFQLAPDDARVIARDSNLDPEDFTRLPAFEAYASLHVDGTTPGWASIRTQPLDLPTTDPAAIRRASAAHYGQPLNEVETDWADLAGQAPDGPQGGFGRTRTGGAV